MKNISTIVLWASLAISVILAFAFFLGGVVDGETSTGGIVDVPVYTDALLYWVYALIGVGVAALIIFALKTLATMFQSDSKAAIRSLGSVVAFFLVMVICYVVSPETDFSRIVNGEVEAFSASEMKMIDMWLFSNYILIGGTVVLIILFALLRLIKK